MAAHRHNPSTAQHSTAQHSTAQHSTVWHTSAGDSRHAHARGGVGVIGRLMTQEWAGQEQEQAATMCDCCKGRVPRGQPRYQLPHAARPQVPAGTMASCATYVMKWCLEALLRARISRVDARSLLSVFPRQWEDGHDVCLVYHTDADGDFGSFRLVLQADGQTSLQCMTCNGLVGGVGGAELHVFNGKPTNNAKKYIYVFGLQLSLAVLTDRINDGLIQARELVRCMSQQASPSAPQPQPQPQPQRNRQHFRPRRRRYPG